MEQDQLFIKSGATDHLANERTFLAWIRTAIAIMAFGFVVVKFSLFVKQFSLVFANKPIVISTKGYSGLIGTLLVALGTLVTLLAFLNYKRTEMQLKKGVYESSQVLTLLLTVLILLVSILLVWYLWPNR